MSRTCREARRSPFASFGIIFCASIFYCGLSRAEEKYAPPASPRITYNFNAAWKFIKQDAPGRQKPDFDDSKWATVSTPHTYNDVDSYTDIISHSGGDRHAYAGIAWYRKHFKLPASAQGGKVFLEFEGLKQAGALLDQWKIRRQVRERCYGVWA